jgi:Nickel responsive protein SCO4226-like
VSGIARNIVKPAVYALAANSTIFRALQPWRGANMKRYLIERELPGVGGMTPKQLQDAAATSNSALAKLTGKVQWVQSFVVEDKTFCIYLADNEASVLEHARLSGFPASKVTEVRTVIDPMTATS